MANKKNNSIIIYTKLGCPYSREAKSFLNILSLPFQEYSLDPHNPRYTQIKQQLSNQFKHNTFPIIIIGNTVLGGHYELVQAYETKVLHHLCHNIGFNIYN